MFVECDQVALPAALWARVKAGDRSAADDVLKRLEGLALYSHALSLDGSPADWAIVTLREIDTALVGHQMLAKLTFEW